MGCKFDEKIIHLYVDDELGETARARIEDHLNICDDCWIKYQSILLLRQKLAAACFKTRAPAHFKPHISNLLHTREKTPAVFSHNDKIKYIFANVRASRPLAIGLVAAAILFLVLSHAGSGLSRLTRPLGQEYISWSGDANEIIPLRDDPQQVRDYCSANLGAISDIPECLSPGFELQGARLITLQSKQMIHLRYSNGKSACSMFVFKEEHPHDPRGPLLIASDREFEIGSSDDINFIRWHKGEVTYILCGCCCFDELARLAVATI
jgi:anti-sigma factor RsiW